MNVSATSGAAASTRIRKATNRRALDCISRAHLFVRSHLPAVGQGLLVAYWVQLMVIVSLMYSSEQPLRFAS